MRISHRRRSAIWHLARKRERAYAGWVSTAVVAALTTSRAPSEIIASLEAEIEQGKLSPAEAQGVRIALATVRKRGQ